MLSISLALLAPLMLVTRLFVDDAAGIEHTLYVGHFDGDRIADTVTGIPTGDLRMLATGVLWGQAATKDPHRSAAEHSRVDIVYPECASLVGSCAVEDFNADGIEDLVIIYDTSGARSSAVHRAVVIIGQSALRTVRAINVAAIPLGIQWQPFVALDVEAMQLLHEPAERELSGVTSHAWRGVPLPLPDMPEPSAAPSELARLMSLYPNPAASMATFKAGRLGPGHYVIELIDAGGRLRHTRPVTLVAEGSVSGTIDLTREAAGAYLVRIRSGDAVIATYPVAVVR